jgi:hypothetical protein
MESGHILLIFAFICACNLKKKNTPFIPLEYLFPESEIGAGKTFIYVDQSTGDSIFHNLSHYQTKGQTYLILTAYSPKERFDSLVYRDNKLLESYSYMFSKTEATRAVILLDTIIDNGRRLGKNILKVEFHVDSTVLAVRSESEFVKDTIFAWQGVSLPSLVIKTIYYTTLKGRNDNFPLTNFQIEFLTYQAKKTGAVRIKILKTKDNQTKYIDLKEIRN